MGIRSIRGPTLQRLIAVLGAAAFAVQGYNQSLFGGFITLPDFLETIPEVNTVTTTGAKEAHNENIMGLMVAILELGSAAGALSCLLVGDRLGRPKTMLLAGSICAVGVVIQTTTYSLGQLLVGRIVTGLGIGFFTGTVPMYVSETAEASHRGSLVLLEGPFALGGLALASWINFGMYYTSGPISWRLPLCLQLVLILALLALIPTLPESPRWLMKKERMEEATAVMSRLMNRPADDPKVAREIAVIHAALQRDTGHRHTYSANPFSMNKNRHLNRLLLAVVINVIVQMTGINAITFYSTYIFEDTLGYSGSAARVFAACLQLCLFLGALTAIFFIDRVGRRRLMLFSTGCLAVAQAAVAGLSSDLESSSAAKAAIFFYFFAEYTLPIGLFSLPFMYGAEVAPLGIRHKVTAMSAATGWLFNFMVAEVSPTAFANISWRYNIVYAATSVAGLLAIYFFFPETKGRSLEEIDEIFILSKTPFDPVRVARELPIGTDILESIIHDERKEAIARVASV